MKKLAYIISCEKVDWNLDEKGKDGTYNKTTVNSRISELQRKYALPDGSLNKR